MKKILSLLLLSVMVLSLGACGAESPDGSTESDGGTVNTDSSGSLSATDEKTDSVLSSSASSDPDSVSDGSNSSTDSDEEDDPVTDSNKTYKILFVGNSYTYYNDMPDLFKAIAQQSGYRVQVQAVTKGGHYLEAHAGSTDEMGAKVEAALKNTKFDYVILQEQSLCPVVNAGKFYDGVRALAKKVREQGATPILYATWGRKTGHSALASNGLTNETMTWKLAAAYSAIGAELGIDVAYVGIAFYDVYSKYAASVELYDEDKTHPSRNGSYLAALTLFAEIFDTDPRTVAKDSQMSDAVATVLKNGAYTAVFATPEIPAAYRISSEGVKKETLEYTVDATKTVNLTALPASALISVLQGGTYPNGKAFSGILGTKNAVASKEYSTTGLTEAQKEDIADIGYGVSVVGVEKMDASSKGYTTAVENLVNGHWGSRYMACMEFDGNRYDVNGNADPDGPYRALITLNFGKTYTFDAIGFSSGSLQGFPGVAEVFVSDDGVHWTRVPTACWDGINGTPLVSAGKTPADPWNGNVGTVTCLFDMNQSRGQYIRVGIIVGRYDSEEKYNTINTRELLVYGQ